MVKNEVASRILELGKQQKSIRDIALAVGLSKSTVSNILKDGITTRKASVEPPPFAPVDSPSPSTTSAVGEQLSPGNEITLVISEDKATHFLKDIQAHAPVDPPDATRLSAGEVKTQAKKEAFVNSFLSGISPATAPRGTGASKPRASRAKAPVSLSSPPASDDDPEKAVLLSTITLNVNSFEPLLRDLLKPSKDEFLNSLRRKSTQELRVVLKMLEHTRTVGNISNQMRHFLYVGATGVELATAQFLKLKSQGFANALRTQDEEIRMIMKEICMERVESLKRIQRPELRLAMIMATTLLAVDSQNRLATAPGFLPGLAPGSSPPPSAVVPPDVATRFADL